MAEKKDVLLVKIVHAFTQGMNGAGISDGVAEWFHDRYAGWIEKPKTNPQAGGTSPLDVWDAQEKKFLAKFQEIGEQVAGGAAATKDVLDRVAETIERASDCPWCPIQD
jgi:hypothetical protein